MVEMIVPLQGEEMKKHRRRISIPWLTSKQIITRILGKVGIIKH
jgi:hypothetical protein